MITRTTTGTHNPRISAQTVANRLREIGEISPINNVCFICGVSFLAWYTCADPESFVRGGPTLTGILVDEGGDKNTTKSGPSSARQRNAINMAFRWRADGGPILNTGLVAL